MRRSLLLLAMLVVVVTSIATPAPASAAIAIPRGYILMPRAQLMRLPVSGPAWKSLVAWAARPAAPNLADQDSDANVVVLAKALVHARTGSVAHRNAVIAALRRLPGTENGARTLAVGRELPAYVLAADLVGYRPPAFTNWLKAMRTKVLSGDTLISTHSLRPNNWGTHAGAARVAIDLFIGDRVDLNRAWVVFAGWLGNYTAYRGFKYGDLSWQSNAAHPVGINPLGAVKKGTNVDGAMPDELRRGGAFPKIGSSGVSYSWEGLQGALLQAELLQRAGYPTYAASHGALRRAVAFLYRRGFAASGDDTWQAFLVNRRYGTRFAPAGASRPGKNFGFTDWLYSR